MRTLTNSEDQVEMPQDAAFQQGIPVHCLLRKKRISETIEINSDLEIITCVPSLYTMDHPKFIVSN